MPKFGQKKDQKASDNLTGKGATKIDGKDFVVKNIDDPQ